MMPVWPNPDLWDEKPRWNGNNKWPLPIPGTRPLSPAEAQTSGRSSASRTAPTSRSRVWSTVEWWHALAINIRMVGAWRTLIGQGPCHPGQWRADGIGVLPPGAPTRLAGPVAQNQRATHPANARHRPAMARPLRPVVANVQHGPGARLRRKTRLNHPNGRPDNPTWLRGVTTLAASHPAHTFVSRSLITASSNGSATRGPAAGNKTPVRSGLRDHGMRVPKPAPATRSSNQSARSDHRTSGRGQTSASPPTGTAANSAPACSTTPESWRSQRGVTAEQATIIVAFIAMVGGVLTALIGRADQPPNREVSEEKSASATRATPR